VTAEVNQAMGPPKNVLWKETMGKKMTTNIRHILPIIKIVVPLEMKQVWCLISPEGNHRANKSKLVKSHLRKSSHHNPCLRRSPV